MMSNPPGVLAVVDTFVLEGVCSKFDTVYTGGLSDPAATQHGR